MQQQGSGILVRCISVLVPALDPMSLVTSTIVVAAATRSFEVALRTVVNSAVAVAVVMTAVPVIMPVTVRVASLVIDAIPLKLFMVLNRRMTERTG
jgi:hypothetical protein